MVYEVYKDLAASEFEKLLDGIIRDLDGYIRWDSEAGENENQWITHNGSGFQSAYFEIDEVGQLTNPLGELFTGLHLTLITRGSTSWYYALKDGAELIDRFNIDWNRTCEEPEIQRQ
jgi:hypothetical protein